MRLVCARCLAEFDGPDVFLTTCPACARDRGIVSILVSAAEAKDAAFNLFRLPPDTSLERDATPPATPSKDPKASFYGDPWGSPNPRRNA